MLLSVCGVVACEPGTCDADEGVLLQAKSLIRKHKQTPPTEEFDSRLSAYWDTGTCGAEVADDYHWAWCGGTKARESGNCPTTIPTDICDSGVAELAEFHGSTTGIINSYTRDGCNYYWHAQYRCTPSCPAGWDQKGALGADIGGCGLQGCEERYDLSSRIECAARCDATWTCQAFSWAPLNGDRNHPGVEACTIYNSDVPTGNLTGVDGTASQVLCGRSFWARLGSEAIGTNTCPAGMEGISQEDCWEAGQRLLPTGVSSDEQDLKLGSWNHVPPGCIVRHGNFNILFNSNPTATNTDDWVPICSN